MNRRSFFRLIAGVLVAAAAPSPAAFAGAAPVWTGVDLASGPSITGFVLASEQLLRDSAIDMEPFVTAGVLAMDGTDDEMLG